MNVSDQHGQNCYQHRSILTNIFCLQHRCNRVEKWFSNCLNESATKQESIWKSAYTISNKTCKSNFGKWNICDADKYYRKLVKTRAFLQMQWNRNGCNPVNFRCILLFMCWPPKVIIIIYSHQSRKKERYWSKSHYRSNTMYYDWVMAVPDPNSTVDTL